MKLSEVTIDDLKNYARVDFSDDDYLFYQILIACQTYIQSYTGLDSITLDTKEDLTIALLVLANELYDNRTFTVQDNKVNTVIKSILDMHCINYL